MSGSADRLPAPKLHGYGCLHTFWPVVFGWFFCGISTLVFLGIPVVFTVSLARTGQVDLPVSDLFGFAFVWLLSAPMAMIMLEYANLYSPVLVANEYLAIRFCFREFRVPWEHIEDLKPLRIAGTRGVLIHVSRASLPWFFALYGVTFWRIGGRYILVSSRIEDYQGLITEIRKRSPHLAVGA